jgi:DNA-directed RNA polymerase subunit RPC12/RpoP
MQLITGRKATREFIMYYECKKCKRRFEKLKKLGKIKLCGDFAQCTDCNNDITKDLDSWFKEVNRTAEFWNDI